MTRTARSWLAASAAILAATLLVASVAYLADTITGPQTVPVDHTPDTSPRSVP